MSDVFRSTGLAPGGKHDSVGLGVEQFNHALDRDRPGTGRRAPLGSSFSLSIIARRGQAPDVAEQNQHKTARRIGRILRMPGWDDLGYFLGR